MVSSLLGFGASITWYYCGFRQVYDHDPFVRAAFALCAAVLAALHVRLLLPALQRLVESTSRGDCATSPDDDVTHLGVHVAAALSLAYMTVCALLELSSVLNWPGRWYYFSRYSMRLCFGGAWYFVALSSLFGVRYLLSVAAPLWDYCCGKRQQHRRRRSCSPFCATLDADDECSALEHGRLPHFRVRLFAADPAALQYAVDWLVGLVTLGLLYPAVRLATVRQQLRLVRLRPGTTLQLPPHDAQGLLCHVGCPNFAMSLVSCGLWQCLGFAAEREHAWLDDHLHVVIDSSSSSSSSSSSLSDQQQLQPLPTYGEHHRARFFRAHVHWLQFATALTSLLTAGLAYPCLAVYTAAQRAQRTWLSVDSPSAMTTTPLPASPPTTTMQLNADARLFVDHVCCPNLAMSLITCGLWSCCGCAEQRAARWLDQRTSTRW
ncbi:MAG: hypothetical protein JSS82_13925 [Bacteroidetes bacterium]|nr:hypothetical protein [Bacteroidota bacterium]